MQCVHRFPGADTRRFLPLTAGIRNAWISSVESHLGLPVLILEFRGATFPASGTICCSGRNLLACQGRGSLGSLFEDITSERMEQLLREN